MHTVTRGGGRDTGLEEVFQKFSCQTTDLSKQESLKEIAWVLRKVIPSTYSLRCDIRLRRHYFLWSTFFNQCMFWEHLLVHILLCSCFSLETFVWIVTPRWFCCRTSVQCPIGILNQISIGSFLTQAANFATRNWKLMTRVAESGLPRFVTLAPNWLYSSSSSSLSPCVFLCVCSCPGSSTPPFLTLSHCQSAKKKPPLPWQ